MQHAWCSKDEDLEVVELLCSISQARKFPPKPVSENSLPLFLAKCVWYAGVRDLISSVHVHAIVVGDDS